MNGGLQLVSLLFLHALTLVASAEWNYDGSGGKRTILIVKKVGKS